MMTPCGQYGEVGTRQLISDESVADHLSWTDNATRKHKSDVGAFSKFAPVVNGGKSEGHDPASYWERNFSGAMLNFFWGGGVMMEKYTVI